MVGGAAVPADAISNVTVSPTHRRRGLLTRMMAADLAAAKDRGDVVATLIAAEYPIYGRYGFGPATCDHRVDDRRTAHRPRPPLGGPDGRRPDRPRGRRGGPQARAPSCTSGCARGQPGAVSRDERWWQRRHRAGALRQPWKEPFYAVYRSADGEVEGLVAYEADDNWGDAKQPQNTGDGALADRGRRRRPSAPCGTTSARSTGSPGSRPAGGPPTTCCRYFLPDPRAAARHHAGGLAVGADPGRRTGAGGADVRGGAGRSCWRCWTRRARPAAATGWTRPATGRPDADRRTPPNSPWTSASWRRCGWATSRRCGWRRWAGWPGGRRAPPGGGRRPAAYVQAAVVPGHLLIPIV